MRAGIIPDQAIKIGRQWSGVGRLSGVNVALPVIDHLATSIAASIATITSKSKLAFKSVENAKRMMQIKFYPRFWCGYFHQPKKYYKDSLSFYFGAFKRQLILCLTLALRMTLRNAHFLVK